MYLIALDDGHGRGTAGKRTPLFADGSYMEENAYNKAVVQLLEELLRVRGFAVLLAAPEDDDTPLETRVKRANDAGADVYVSIHANAYGNDWNSANGVESWVYDKADQKTIKMAEAIHREVIDALGRKDRGIKKSGDLYVLRKTKMPAILIEGGFMTNPEEAELLRSDSYRRKTAEGICRGLCAYYGVSYDVDEKKEKKEEEVMRYQKIEDLPYGKEIMKKLVEEGVISGDENGNLNLTEDMVRIFMILDRKELL
ncbi:N-acetylmuramoyl-L-alanine amidase [Anaerotignum lactatifermentans]|uniref:N-acetylmuramoyl-L-alanine amidase n=1 Tax=Anaerotignum lactatifermentans TaxID=160404 RepID=A0ABS2G7P8_9FIRM|nr:N-acetylmuramoyl-L-alanine amidase [Anaerotignum lactatifermentans]MBM6829264.1 N-acetylmuramoyl-L-alanine amidase [Anaerotignum lactatifermentans]MBM6877496.1 N-acetylmuramoyl-L-alanine amidase [Anaerotignum lactatifermentans]MBM6950842.1 N-acetylmuramoyl-L-alanine amidase [Anaerotignum lactatifermentans]